MSNSNKLLPLFFRGLAQNAEILTYLWWHLREVSFFELAWLVVDVDDGGDQGEGGQEKKE